MKPKVNIIHKNPHYMVLFKPAGMLVHGAKIGRREEEGTVADWVKTHVPEAVRVGDNPEERPGIVHRLDRETSGVLLIAKTQAFFDHAKRCFQTHQIAKTYLALVYGDVPKKLHITLPIGLKPGTTKRSTRAKNMKMVKEAVTDVEPVASYVFRSIGEKGREHAHPFTLVRAHPKTGRTHQIRVHLASAGHAVVGDVLYGPKTTPFPVPRHFLHAESLELPLPGGNRARFEAVLPKDLASVLAHLEKA